MSSDSCSVSQHPLLDSLQNQSLWQAVLCQAVVVWSGRKESCRVSLHLLCPSGPTAVHIFCQSRWICFAPKSTRETCKYSPAPTANVSGTILTEVYALERRPLSYLKYAEGIFSKIEQEQTAALHKHNVCIWSEMISTAAVGWLWCQLEAEKPAMCEHGHLNYIKQRNKITLISEKQWDSVMLNT